MLYYLNICCPWNRKNKARPERAEKETRGTKGRETCIGLSGFWVALKIHRANPGKGFGEQGLRKEAPEKTRIENQARPERAEVETRGTKRTGNL